MSARARKSWVLAALWLLAACSEDPAKLTQIVVVIDSDLSVPEQLDALQIEVSGIKEAQTIDAPLDADHKLPRSLGLMYSGGPLGPLRVSARGLRAGELVVERAAEVHFQKDRTLKLALALTRLCAEKMPVCESDQTCAQGECIETALTSLPVFDGDDGPFVMDGGAAPRVDGGMPVDSSAADGGSAEAGEAGSDPITCSITKPADSGKFYRGDAIIFEGSCTGLDGAKHEPRWGSSGATLGTSSPLTRDDLGVGTHEISLCVRDTSECATPIQITVEPLPELSAAIVSLTQAGASDGVYSADAELVVKGEGSGVPPVKLTWTDSLQGEVGTGETIVLAAPVAGKHRLRLLVSDGHGREIKAEERNFVVHAPGRNTLFETYALANSVLSSNGKVSALASTGAFHYVGTNAGYLLQVNADVSHTAGPSIMSTSPMEPRPGVLDLFVHASSNTLYFATSNDVQSCSIANATVSACVKLALAGLGPAAKPRCARRVSSDGADYLVVGTSAGLWVGTQGMYDKGGLRVNNGAFNALAESSGKLWIAGASDLFGYTLDNNLSGSPQTFDGSGGELKAIVTSPDAIWATLSDGITRYEAGDQRWTKWSTSFDQAAFGRLVSDDVRSIAITRPVIDGAAHEVIWVATGAGLSRFDPKVSSFTSYTDGDGLPNNEVLRVVGLPSNELLLATPSGLAIHRGQ